VGEVRSWIKKPGETRKGLVAQIVTRWNQKPITIAMLCSCDDVPTPSNFAESVLFRSHRQDSSLGHRLPPQRSGAITSWQWGGAANDPILQNIQLQACINEDQFHFGTLYKTKLEIFENC